MTTAREQFEQAAATKLKVDKSWIEQERDGEHYKSRWDSMSILQPLSDWWEWWQASRAAIVVELPSKCMCGDNLCKAGNFKISQCDNAVRAAGITVKGEDQ